MDPDYEALEMKVGSYINAEGKVVRDAADAVEHCYFQDGGCG